LPRPRRQIDEYARRARALANELAEGRLAPADWRDATAAVVRDAHATAAVAAAGPDGVDPGALSEVVADQLRYLDDFAADVASGEQPLDGRLLARAEMYAQAANATYEETRRGVKVAEGLRWERRVLGRGSEHCDDCKELAARGWQPVGTLPPVGSTRCIVNCTCRFQYSSSRERPSDASFSGPDFESKHPRARGGRFGTKSRAAPARAKKPAKVTDQTPEHVKHRGYLMARVRAMTDDGVPPERLAAYHATVEGVLTTLPPASLARLNGRLFSGAFYQNLDTLNAEFHRRGGNVRGDSSAQCAGFAQMGRGEIHLDQPDDSESVRRGVYAHELGHIIDAGTPGTPPISSSRAWQAAWQEEVVDRGTVSDYARTSALEGFAEYWRMADVHAQDMVRFHGLTPEQASQQVAARMARWLPKCTAVMQAHGAL
jgi:hypothetical protein